MKNEYNKRAQEALIGDQRACAAMINLTKEERDFLLAEVEAALRDQAKETLEEMARVFEGGEEYNAQTFYGSDKDDEVQLSFRVMAIIAHRIRQQAEKL